MSASSPALAAGEAASAAAAMVEDEETPPTLTITELPAAHSRNLTSAGVRSVASQPLRTVNLALCPRIDGVVLRVLAIRLEESCDVKRQLTPELQTTTNNNIPPLLQ